MVCLCWSPGTMGMGGGQAPVWHRHNHGSTRVGEAYGLDKSFYRSLRPVRESNSSWFSSLIKIGGHLRESMQIDARRRCCMNQSAMRVRNVFDHADWGDRQRRVASTSCSAVLLPPGRSSSRPQGAAVIDCCSDSPARSCGTHPADLEGYTSSLPPRWTPALDDRRTW